MAAKKYIFSSKSKNRRWTSTKNKNRKCKETYFKDVRTEKKHAPGRQQSNIKGGILWQLCQHSQI